MSRSSTSDINTSINNNLKEDNTSSNSHTASSSFTEEKQPLAKKQKTGNEIHVIPSISNINDRFRNSTNGIGILAQIISASSEHFLLHKREIEENKINNSQQFQTSKHGF